MFQGYRSVEINPVLPDEHLTETAFMPRFAKEDAIKTIQHSRSQLQAILHQNIPARELGRKLRMDLDRAMLCALLSDLELGLLSVEYLNDIIENGW